MLWEKMFDHSEQHRDCPACERERLRHTQGPAWAEWKFRDAFPAWLQERARRLRSKTVRDYADYGTALGRFFGDIALKQIHVGHIVSYQRMRQNEVRSSVQHAALKRKTGGGPSDSDGASKINHEISCVLRPMLQACGLWEAIQRHYRPLPLPKAHAGIAISEEEERHLFSTARARPRWLVAYCCALIDQGAKNLFRERPVPLNDDAMWALRALLERYHALCRRYRVQPSADHFLLPHRARTRAGCPLFDEPQESWKRAWRSLCRQAGVQFPRLTTLRYYDLRHTAATALLEDPSLSFSTIEAMMGHRLGSKTKRRYEHVRNAGLRAAAARLQSGYSAEPPAKKTCPLPEGAAGVPPRQPNTAKKPAAAASSGATWSYLLRHSR
jgi:hypothetical protein